MDFEEMMQKAVNAKAEAGLKPSIMVWKSDAHYPRGHRPSHNTFSKVQTQGTTAKKPRTKESKLKEAKQADGKAPALPWSKSTKFGKTSRIDKRREYLEKKKKKRDRKIIPRQLEITPMPLRLARRKNGTTEATRDAIIARKKAIFRETAWNLQKTSVGLSNFHAGDE